MRSGTTINRAVSRSERRLRFFISDPSAISPLEPQWQRCLSLERSNDGKHRTSRSMLRCCKPETPKGLAPGADHNQARMSSVRAFWTFSWPEQWPNGPDHSARTWYFYMAIALPVTYTDAVESRANDRTRHRCSSLRIGTTWFCFRADFFDSDLFQLGAPSSELECLFI